MYSNKLKFSINGAREKKFDQSNYIFNKISNTSNIYNVYFRVISSA